MKPQPTGPGSDNGRTNRRGPKCFRNATDTRSYRQLLEVARQWPQRIWAADGERVLDVPAKLAARARVFDTGQGRKTDAEDAHAIVMVALRDKGLRELRTDPELTVLRMLCDRRDELSRARAQTLNRLHRLFLGLLAGGAPVRKSASQYKPLLATVRPRDLAGKTCRRMAAEELEDPGRLDAKLKTMKAELKVAVQATGSHLMDIHGIGPAGAARILADVGDITRFPDRGHFASWNGAAPIDASSGQHTRHRLSRAGNPRVNHVLYIAGIVQLRNDTPGHAYYRRKLQQSKTSMEAMRCLRRRLSDAVYRQLVTDAATRRAAQQANSEEPSAAALSSSPAGPTTPRPRQLPHHDGAPEASTWSAPLDERR